MLRNLPDGFNREMLFSLLDAYGFGKSVNFLYVPMRFKEATPLGYGFVNLTNAPVADECWKAFQGFTDWPEPSAKVCECAWSDLQGYSSHVERFRNSPLMHKSVLDEFKPAVYSNGSRIAYPTPSRPVRAPRIRGNKGDKDLDGDDLDSP